MDLCDGDRGWSDWRISLCRVDWINVGVGLCSLYATSLVTGYLKWGQAKGKESSCGRILPWHDYRGLLHVFILLAHLLELSDAFLTFPPSHILAVSTASFAFWANSLLLSHVIESTESPNYLVLSSMLWCLNGLARFLRFVVLTEAGVPLRCLRPLTALSVSMLAVCLGIVEAGAWFRQKSEKGNSDVPLTTTSRYKHDSAHFLSKTTFHWLTPLLRTGYSCPLEMEDLGVLPEHHRGKAQLQAFEEYYSSVKGKPLKVFWKSCWIFIRKDFLFGGIWKLLGDMFSLVGPLGISIIVNFIAEEKSKASFGHIAPAYPTLLNFWKNGWTMSVVVLIASVAQSTCSQTSTHLVNVKAIHLNAALQAKIYTKSLRLSKFKKDPDNDKEGDRDEAGTVSHLLSEDTFNIMSAFWVGHYIWAIPLKISLLLLLLYSYMGTSALVGSLLTILLLTPLQLFIGKAMSSNATSLSDVTDERLQQVSSLIGNAKLLKMLAWEMVFADKISKARSKEEEKLNKDSMFWASMTFLTHIASILAVVITLATHQWIDGSALTPNKVFTVLALFNQLTVPLFIFPVTVPIFIAAAVSGKRLSDFFALPEIEKTLPKSERVVKPPFNIQQEEFGFEGSIADFGGLWSSEISEKIIEDEETQGIEVDDDIDVNKSSVEDSEETALRIEDAHFKWGNDSKSLMLQVGDVTVPKGKLTMIVGKVGSGKTCFISALLGEMKIVKGELQWRRNTLVAYASQSPWLLNGTVRENITFGRPFRPGRYAQVLAACALEPDLDILPDKDLTEIGEKGIQLSGGQKQRIGVARALYSRANFVILDDPLSSLDHTLALHVFEAGIKRLVRRNKRTVLLVAHHLALLQHSHKVIVMDEGKVRIQGQFNDLESLDRDLKEVLQTCEDSEQLQGRTARERWQLVKLVASIGLELKQRLLDPSWQSEEEITEMPLTRKPTRHRNPPLSEWSFLSHDLLLPTEECGVVRPAWRQSYSKRRRMMTRANSLQTRQIRVSPITRQFSSPLVLSDRQRNRGSSKSLLRKMLGNGPPLANTRPKLHQPVQRLSSTESGFSDASSEADPDELDDSEMSPGGVGNEEREYGRIPRRVCKAYIKSCGAILSVLYFGITLAWQTTRVATDTWLTKWTETPENHDTCYFLSIYGCLSALAVILSLASHGVGQWASAKARVALHKDLVSHIIRCQMSVFETTPAGRFLNRFSTDIGVIDKKLGPAIQRLVQFVLLCGSALLVNAAVTPWFLILAVPICVLYFAIQRFYRTSSRELQRLDSMSRSPVLSHMLETQTGLSTIRAYGLEEKFTSIFLAKLDQHTNAFMILNSSNRWLGIVLDYLGGVIVYLAIVTALLSASFASGHVTPSLVGLAINYTLLVPIYLNWVVKFLAECEMYMGAVERISQCLRLPVEIQELPATKIPDNWPAKGAIKFVQVTLRYSSTREPVFTSLNLLIPAGQKLGICGRSGSGKSTLILSLFRLLETSAGRITIDGVDIATVPLPKLRSVVAIMPQEASLLSGTVRGNLDPEVKCSDEELWAALDAVKLKDTVKIMFNGLDGEIREGVTLSSGQRQLFCLARAVLQKAATLVMDEATSNLDCQAEQLLMSAAKAAFSGKTIIVIAHRLSTLTDCDRILVLDRGRIVEDGPPEQLQSKQMGLFSTMLRTAENTAL